MKRHLLLLPVMAVFLAFGCEGGNLPIVIDGLEADSKFTGDSKTNDLKEPADDTKEDRQQADDDGTVADDDTKVTDDDGTVTDDDGTVADDDGTVADDDGTVADDDGTVADDDGTVADDDGTVADDDGTVADDDGTVADDDGTEPQECEIDADCEGEPQQCHKFTCEEGECTEVPVADDTSCSDGDLCTVGDTCQNGVCVSGPDMECEGEPQQCHQFTCEEGECTEVPVANDTSCSDGDLCTVGDTCQNGECVSGPAKECEGEPQQCHEFTCEEGECTEVPVANDTPCSDGDLCTVGDTCQNGMCVSGPDMECDDNNECTEDNCDPTTGVCVYEPIITNQKISCGQGECFREVLKCIDGVENVCVPGEPAPEEICDGLDNDCDGEIDNDIPGVGSDCKIQSLKGVCADGLLVCEEAELFCKQINYPSAEVCNGLDDNCDGETDPPGSEGCITQYKDADGDGYGNPSDSICVCDPKPVDGYVLNSEDCCDQDEKAYPGATDWFTTANGCGSFDYNCSEAIELQFPDRGKCAALSDPPNSCALTEGWSGPLVPRCGGTGNYIVGCQLMGTVCIPLTRTRTQGCH